MKTDHRCSSSKDFDLYGIAYIVYSHYLAFAEQCSPKTSKGVFGFGGGSSRTDRYVVKISDLINTQFDEEGNKLRSFYA